MMAESTMSTRLRDYFSQKRLTMQQVSYASGIQYDTLQQILSGKVKAMGVDKFAAIWQAYPDLDAWHILTGQLRTSPCVEVENKLSRVRSIVNA